MNGKDKINFRNDHLTPIGGKRHKNFTKRVHEGGNLVGPGFEDNAIRTGISTQKQMV